MTRFKSWILTDVLNDVWLDNVAISNDSLRLPTPHDWSIRKRTLRGGRRDGIDLIEIHNGALSFAVLVPPPIELKHQEYLYHNICPFVQDEFKDTTCPRPTYSDNE